MSLAGTTSGPNKLMRPPAEGHAWAGLPPRQLNPTGGSRKVLIDSSLNGIYTYYMSLFKFHVTFSEKLWKSQRTFFSQGGHSVRKCHIIKWQIICKPKDRWGLGIKNLDKMNISLLCKWCWKIESGEGLWQDIYKISTYNIGLLLWFSIDKMIMLVGLICLK
jgi:hypothetical protein